MTTVTLADLVAPVSYSDALASEMSIAAALGLPTTVWQPIDPLRSMMTTNAQIVSDYSAIVNLIAQGGYASYAAIMPAPAGSTNADSDGYLTTWLDLIASDEYNVQRIEASFAITTLTLVNSTPGTFGPFTPGTLHFQYAGAQQPTYANTSTVTIAPSTSTTVQIIADAGFPGPLGQIPSGATLVIVTPMAGVTVNALTSAVQATPQETNAHLLTRCQNKLGSLSPNGPAQAYSYVVTSLPQQGQPLADGTIWTQPTEQNPYGTRGGNITRAATVLSTGAGVVNVYVANENGPPAGCVQLSVFNVTDSSPPIVDTAGAHGMVSGDFCTISGVLGATGVNNSPAGQVAWSVQVIGPASFYLYGLDNTTPAPAPGVFVLGPTGNVDGGDLGMCDAAVQGQVVPDGMTALVSAAQAVPVAVVVVVWIKARAGLTDAQATANVSDAIAANLDGVPIGGVNAELPNVVPYSEVLVQIANANPGTVSVNPLLLNGAVADVTLAANQVPVLGTTSISVVFV